MGPRESSCGSDCGRGASIILVIAARLDIFGARLRKVVIGGQGHARFVA